MVTFQFWFSSYQTACGINVNWPAKQPTETLQEYMQKFSDLLLKSSGFLLHQAKDLAHIIHFICNCHNQKLQHYVLGTNPTSVQNSITLAQKYAELYIIEGLHNHDPGHEINNIYNKQHENQNSDMGSYHDCNVPHLVKDCEDSVCKRCKLNLDKHTPARCPRKRTPSRQQRSNSSYTKKKTLGISLMVTMTQIFNYPFLPVNWTILLNYWKPQKMTRYIKSHINILNHTILALTVTTLVQIITAHFTHMNINASHTTLMIMLMKLLDKHVLLKTKNQNQEILRTPHDSDSPDSNLDSSSDSEWLSLAGNVIEVKLSNMKYAANFPITINKNNTISLFYTGATISCMSKGCFNKLQPSQH